MTTPQAARDEAVARVEANAAPDWKNICLRAIRYVASKNRTFTSDDVWDALRANYPQVRTHEPRAMGPMFTKAVKNGWCQLQGCDHCGTRKVMVMSRREQANGMDTPVYLSLVYGQPITDMEDR